MAISVKGSGGGGTDTSDATATALDILQGKTAYISSGKVTGAMGTYANSYTEIPKGELEYVTTEELEALGFGWEVVS